MYYVKIQKKDSGFTIIEHDNLDYLKKLIKNYVIFANMNIISENKKIIDMIAEFEKKIIKK